MAASLVGLAVLYGRRDLYLGGGSRPLVTRPDDTMFIQNDTNTYRRIQVPMVPPPEDRTNRLEGVARRQAKEGTMANTMSQAVLDSVDVVHRYEVGRTLSPSGKAWLIELEGPGGKRLTVSRLRSSREGNGF